MALDRRTFLTAAAAGLGAASVAGPLARLARAAETQPAGKRLNFVWIVAEDFSPTLRCYGDKAARTPNIDDLAEQGVRYTNCFTHAPVSAPSRCGLVTGRYPTTLGAHHMRSRLAAPPPVFTTLLRKAGYYVSWGGGGGTASDKKDFNFEPAPGWTDPPVPFAARKPLEPFFAYTNLFNTHEGQLRQPPTDPKFAERATLPPYYPDAPEFRAQMTRYYEQVAEVDRRVGALVDGLRSVGALDNTVVMFFGDHGWGMPRGKRWLYDSGMRVPLIVRWPGGKEDQGPVDDLVSFVDFAPTILSLAGVEAPASMQGQVFLGPHAAEPRKYVYAARDRMDETFDRIRAVRSRRFKYIRNFHPELPYAQNIAYMDRAPAMQAWRKLAAEGKLSGPSAAFFAPQKPPEELYDVTADPFETKNLAESPEHRETLVEMRQALDQWVKDTKDLGEVPEAELVKRGILAPAAAK